MSKKNKLLIGTISILVACVIVVGISYAYWRLTYTQTGVNKIVSSCFSMELTNEKNNITLESAYPISDEKGKSLTPYSFTITNTCDLFASYTINLEMLEGTTLDSKYVKTMINSEAITNLNTLEITDTSIEGATESKVLFKGSLGAGDSTDYTLRIWMDSDTPPIEDTMNKIFQGKITVTAKVSTYSPVANGFTNLAEALLVNEYQTTSLDVAKNKVTSKQSVDTTKTAPIIDWQEVHNNLDTISFEITKTDPELIGSYGIDEYSTKLYLGKSYSFNPETGYYTLTDSSYYYPLDIDFSVDDYYFCNGGINTSSSNTVTYHNLSTCATLYKIDKLTSVKDVNLTLSSGTIINAKRYTFEMYEYMETELESDKSDKGLYESEDDYGITYYYRGNVSNNYVYFAGLYWKVIRINGDRSVRLLYLGATKDAVEEGTIINTTHYNSNRLDHTYIGYMYSNTIDTSYEDTISNDKDSTIKSIIDSWYKTNIEDKGYSSYIADSGFCNDRSVKVGDGYSTNTQYTSYYKAFYNEQPSYKCSNIENDLFTLADNSIGNKSLTYPIGLITADELIFSGLANGFLNKMTYTYSGAYYWTMSPGTFSVNTLAASMIAFDNVGSLANQWVNVTHGVRPVINLKADTEISGGIGTKNDPFIIK